MPSRRNNRHKKTQRVNKHRKFTGGIGTPVGSFGPNKSEINFSLSQLSDENSVYFVRGMTIGASVNISKGVADAASKAVTMTRDAAVAIKTGVSNLASRGLNMFGLSKTNKMGGGDYTNFQYIWCYHMKITKNSDTYRIEVNFNNADHAFFQVVPIYMILDGLNAMTGLGKGNRKQIKAALIGSNYTSYINRNTQIKFDLKKNSLENFKIVVNGKETAINTDNNICGVLSFFDRTLGTFADHGVLFKVEPSDQGARPKEFAPVTYTRGGTELCSP